MSMVNDLDHLDHPQLSQQFQSLQPSPKKRPGAPKAKGSVRAKSGCYTCRIRRKKCDEQPDDRGACATCVRLRLQCLGFGSKRPEWLKENNNVTVFREKIKDFLAAQGMIKGHSGANNGRDGEAQQILVLIPEHVRGRGASSSPPTTPSSAADDDLNHHQHHLQHHRPRISDARADLPMSAPPGAAAAAYHSLHMGPAPPSVHHHHHPQAQAQQQHAYGASHYARRLPSASQPHSSFRTGGYALSDLSPTSSLPPHSLSSSDFTSSLTLPSSMSVASSHPTTVSHSASSWHGNPSDVAASSSSSLAQAANHPSYQQQTQQQPQQQPQPQQPPQLHHRNSLPVVPTQAYPSALPAHQVAQMPQQFASTLPSSYQYTYEPDHTDAYAQEDVAPEWQVAPSLQTNVFPAVHDAQNLLVQHYLAHVLKRQYLLADDSIQPFIVHTIQKSTAVRDAVCLLASLHQQSLRRRSGQAAQTVLALPSVNNEDDSTYARICLTLQKQRPGLYTEEEALTGLLVVSAFLFRGGRGAWAQFLNVATEWVAVMLQMAQDPADVLIAAAPSQRFIIKTTFWFDILAATTRGEAPRFLTAYRLLWGVSARGAFIGPAQPSGGSGGGGSGGARAELSMLDVMGADNATALALAETAELAAWRDRHTREGTLSLPDLVDRARRIEQDYLAQPSPTIPPARLYGAPEDDLSIRRRLTANIFRATAKVYLHAVVSGDRPRVPEIRAGVRETLSALQQVPAARSALSSSVLRSVVFGICLAGCLTDEWEERQLVLRRLEEEQEEGVGNCSEARRVMECVWRRRAETPPGGAPVSWREVVHELGGGESLLLV